MTYDCFHHKHHNEEDHSEDFLEPEYEEYNHVLQTPEVREVDEQVVKMLLE